MKVLAIDQLQYIAGNEYRVVSEYRERKHYQYFVLVKCSLCGNEIFREKASFKKGHNPQCGCGTKPLFECFRCGKETRRFSHSGTKNKFCSHKCYEESLINEGNPNWKGGLCIRQPDERIRSIINKSIKRNTDSRTLQSILGYTMKELRLEIEKKFQHGMDWQNRNKWHIDHIIPRSVFNYSSEKDIDFRKCWSLKNLQPLWSNDNLKKHSKLNKPFQPSLRLEV